MHKPIWSENLPHDGQMKLERVQLDPRFPLCWESTDTLRIGFETARVRLHEPTPQEQRFISKLGSGVMVHELAGVAKKCGLSEADQRALLRRLERVLVRVPASNAASRKASARRSSRTEPAIRVLGDGEFAAELHKHLARAGVSVALSTAPPDESADSVSPAFTIVLERFFGSATTPHVLFSNGVPHFPICLTDDSLFAGPLVPPGGSPCLACVELHRIDAMPLIAVLAAQLVTVTPAAETPRCAELAASLALLAFRQWRAEAPGAAAARLRFPVHEGTPVFAPTAETIAPHPECSCGLFREAP